MVIRTEFLSKSYLVRPDINERYDFLGNIFNLKFGARLHYKSAKGLWFQLSN